MINYYSIKIKRMFLVSSLINKGISTSDMTYDLFIARVHLSALQSTSLQGVRDVIAVDELFDAVPAINRSFHHVKVNTFSKMVRSELFHFLMIECGQE